MSLVLSLLAVLAGPYAFLTLIGLWLPRARLSPRDKVKAGLTLLFLITGSAHFVVTEPMARMIPPFLTARTELVYLTGLFELLGAVGMWVPALARLTGWCLILLLIAVFPANIYAALHHIPVGGHELGPPYLLLRIPFQLLLIALVYFVTRPQGVNSAAASSSDATAP